MRVDMKVVERFRQQVTAEYVKRHPKSREMRARAEATLPGGDTRTVTYFSPSPPTSSAATVAAFTTGTGTCSSTCWSTTPP